MPFPTIDQCKTICLEFCQPPRQPQMITISKSGAARVRTLGAALQPDWTVRVVSRKTNGRTRQVARNPNVTFVYTDQAPPPEGAPPRVIVLYGLARFGTIDDFRPFYERIVAAGIKESIEEAFQTRAVIVTKIYEVRMEGFAAEGEKLTFPEITSGLTFPV